LFSFFLFLKFDEAKIYLAMRTKKPNIDGREGSSDEQRKKIGGTGPENSFGEILHAGVYI